MINNILRDIKVQASPARAKASAWYFKTKKGQYGEGDKFIGLTVPEMRVIAKKYKDIPLDNLSKLLKSPIHEHRFIALEILVMQYEAGSSSEQRKVARYYLKNLQYVNNWDLVDTSAPYILGDYLRDRSRQILYKLARSKKLWQRRVAIVSTSKLISLGQMEDTIQICQILLADSHDLIHKAAGWMLREVGKKDEKVLIKFLNQYSRMMPRTMLRYAIEKLAPKVRKYYLNLPANLQSAQRLPNSAKNLPRYLNSNR